jgi:hypothetical protein
MFLMAAAMLQGLSDRNAASSLAIHDLKDPELPEQRVRNQDAPSSLRMPGRRTFHVDLTLKKGASETASLLFVVTQVTSWFGREVLQIV